MPKKSKRQSRRSSSTTRVTTPVAASANTYEKEFNPDYSNTIKDLRRIGILAGSFITILIVLAFFLR